MFIMAANSAGIVGGQLFRSDDLPYYHRGWSIIAAFMSFALILVISLLIIYNRLNARTRKQYGIGKEEPGDAGAFMEQGGPESGVIRRKVFNY